LVAIQQPADLDAAYTMALVDEELVDGGNPFSVSSSTPTTSTRWQFHFPHLNYHNHP
jgi:hypothetical protein